jgi:2-polyprenyl-3-methyl-5-hydroxy-6-metoxy-1,4-benzoquinol methylase
VAERQQAVDFEGIRADHTGRYRFAASHVRGQILDAACGCGYGSWMLAETGAKVRGVDLSSEALDFARVHWGHRNVTYTQADAAHVSGLYDWIVCFETLEHVEDDGALVRHFATLASRLIISVPNQDQMPFNGHRFPFHVRHYTQEELACLLRGAGWKVREWHCQESKITQDVVSGAHGLTLIAVAER